MKTIYFFSLVLCSFVTQAQDISLKNTLIEQSIKGQIGLTLAQPITKAIADTISRIDLGGLGLENISDLLYFPNLKELNLSNNKLTDISTLMSLNELEYVNVANNKLDDIAYLALSDAFSYTLEVSNNFISDFESINNSRYTIIRLLGQETQKPLALMNAHEVILADIYPIIIDSVRNYVEIRYKAYTSTGNKGILSTGDGTSYSVLCDGWINKVLHQYCKSGTYIVRLTLDGKELSDTLRVGEPKSPEAIKITKGQPIFCNGGSINLDADVGSRLGYELKLNANGVKIDTVTVPLQYQWYKDGKLVEKATKPTFTADASGIYKVAIKSANACGFYDSIKIIENPTQFISVSAKNITCQGNIDGEISLTFSDNSAPYTVSWTHDNTLKTTTVKNLGVGTYKAIVQNKLGCTDSVIVQITQPDPLFLTAIVQNVSKQGIKDAKINLVPRGGTAFSNGLYRYEWLLPDGSKRKTEDLDSLTSGKYEIVVTDSMGCAAKLSVLVSEPDVLSLKVIKFVKPSCLLAKDGYLEVQAEGGVPKYSFKSNTGDTASVQNGKIFIVRNIGVTEIEKVEIMLKDQKETAITQFFNLTIPTGEPAISLPKNEYCLTDQNPKISISGVQNGKLIIPNGLVVDSTNTILLAKSTAGKHKIGYQTSQSVCKIKDFELTIHGLPFNSLKAKTIFACDSAVLDAKNTGGTYLWSTGQTTQKITVFKDSSYTVKINIGTCQITDTIKVKLSKIQISVKTTEGDCTGKGGSAEITAKNGIGKYRYQWSHNSTINTNKAENLAAGNYTVKVLDSLNCEKTILFSIKTPKLVQKIYKNTTITACNSIVLDLKNEGSLYKLNGKSSIQKPIIDKSGTYFFEIDNGECKILDTVKVVLSNIQIKTEQKNPVCSNSPDGFLKITAKDGIGKMSIRWNDDQTPNLWIRENLAIGNYTTTITDSVGCAITKNFTIEAPTKPLTATANVTGTTGCFGENNGEIRIMATGGLPPYKYFLNGQPSNALIKNVANGIFLITVQDSNKCSFPLRVLMYQSDAMQIQKTVKNSACADTNNGSITLKITGGYAPYKIEFTHDVSKTLQENETFVLDNLAPRPNVPYEALITDAKGCAKTISEKITVAPKSKIRFLNEQTTLCKGEKALIKVKYEGSIYPFDLIYTDGQKQVELKNQVDSLLEIPVLAEKTVKIRLEKLIYGKLCEGEVDKKQFSLNVNDLPEIEKIEISDEKENRSNGEIIILMPLKKGKEPFSFSLDGKNFQDSLRFRKLKAGEYTLFVKDANNCVSTYPQKILIRNTAISFQGIHNAISPNQDGINDTWEVPSIQSFPDAKITIFDRYGNLVFQTNTGQAWDGTQDGKELSLGTYFYLIELKNKQPVKGFIDLVR